LGRQARGGGVGLVGRVGGAGGVAAGWTMCYVRPGWGLLCLSPYQPNKSPSVAPFPVPFSSTTSPQPQSPPIKQPPLQHSQLSPPHHCSPSPYQTPQGSIYRYWCKSHCTCTGNEVGFMHTSPSRRNILRRSVLRQGRSLGVKTKGSSTGGYCKSRCNGKCMLS
jgi:hypothetical protein